MKKSGGFTLIEILVVATIIILLTAGAIVSYSNFLKQARDAKRKTDLEQVRAALEIYRSNVGSYPNALATLTTPIVYIQSVPTDPRTYSYYYESISSGADYLLAAHLETTGVTCQSLISQCGGNCSYCLGPYGEIQ